MGLLLRLELGAAVPSAAQLATELGQALSLPGAPDIEVLAVEPAAGSSGAAVLFVFRGADAGELAMQTRQLPQSTLHAALHATSVSPVSVHPPSTPSQRPSTRPPGSGSTASRTPKWVVPVVAVMGVLLGAVAVVLVVKRRAIFGASPGMHPGDATPEPGRINDGGRTSEYRALIDDIN